MEDLIENLNYTISFKPASIQLKTDYNMFLPF